MAQSIHFIGDTISHTNLLFDENHLNIIAKAPPGEFLRFLVSTLQL